MELKLRIWDDKSGGSKRVDYAYARLFLMDEGGTCPGSSYCCLLCYQENREGCDYYLPVAMTHENKDKPCFAKERHIEGDNSGSCSPRIIEGTDELLETEDFDFQVAHYSIRVLLRWVFTKFHYGHKNLVVC